MSDKNLNISWPGWETVKLIGRGSFGAVYEIERILEKADIEEKAALKVISIPQNASDIEEMYNDGYDNDSITETFNGHLKSIVAEYSLMKKMNDCVNIVNCDDIRYIQHDDGIGWDIFIKMELLTPLAKSLPETITDDIVIKLGSDICNALVTCKKFDVVHRDIKPQNIFISPNGDYKLGDFGIAKTVEKTMGGTKIGTYKYMAPEVYNNQPYGSSADIYSLGLVLYWLLNEHRMPFLPLPPEKIGVGKEEEARHRRLSGEILPPPKHGSERLKQIVLKACAYDPKKRFSSATEMFDVLNNINIAEETKDTSVVPVVVGDFGDVSGGNTAASENEPPAETPRTIYEPAPKSKKQLAIVASIAAIIIATIVLFFVTNDKDSANVDFPTEDVGATSEKQTTTENKTTKEQAIIVGTGGKTGTYYTLTNTICSFLNTDTYNFKVKSTGGTVDNLEMISEGDIQLALVQGDMMNYAYKGINGFSKALTGFSAIACVYPEVCHIVATEASGIKTISDLKGKNVAIGDSGSDVFYNATQILSSAGIDYNSDINATLSSFGACTDLLKNGTIDAVFITSNTNSTSVKQLAEMVNIVVVELDNTCISNLTSKYSYYTKYTITESDYTFVNKSINTVAVMATYIISDNVSEAQVYEITKNLWNNQENISLAHNKGKEMNINNAIVVGDIPIHPGALKFYNEHGVLTEEITVLEVDSKKEATNDITNIDKQAKVGLNTPGHSGLNMRAEASSDSKLLCIVKEGAKLDILSFDNESNGYINVGYDHPNAGVYYEGWVLKSYLEY